MNSLGVIIPAAGQSRRFGRNKLLENLAGKAVIARSVGAFLQRTDVRLVVIPTADEPAIRTAIGSADPRLRFCPGGPTRAHSVQNALGLIDSSIEWIAVHDAARPLVSQSLIDAALAAARTYGAAVPALPVHLTIKEADGPLPAPVRRTIPRQRLWAMQTPQIMRQADLARALARCPIPLDQITDDAQLLELAGQQVWLLPGDELNLKITTALDLRIAESQLQAP